MRVRGCALGIVDHNEPNMAAQLAVSGGGAHCSYQRSVSTMTAQREAAEQEALGVLAKEVCQWLSQTLHSVFTPQSLMDNLDTGVELCKLVGLIQTKATESVKAGEKLDFKMSATDPIQCHKSAKKRSFQARENAQNFTKWCKSLGISNDLLFESNGLVEHSNERSVILCLLEVSRYARKVHIQPPKIVEIEHDIDEREKSIHTPVDNQTETDDETKNLDQEVRTRVKKCKCPTKKLTFARDERRPMFGKYVMSGGRIRDKKIIHVRRLSNTIMVRVGGGWVTLDHFLLDHDPCRIEEFNG